MKVRHHIAASTVIAGALYLFFNSWKMSASCLVSGVLIDMDHIFDYLREFGLPFRVRHFIAASYTNALPRWTLVFHSWELLVLLFAVAWITSWNPWIAGIAVGFSHHVVLDKLHTGEKLRTYLFTWRWKNAFRSDILFPNIPVRKNSKRDV